ncbi:MAG: hypothetical protein WCY41_05805 [Candidatus Micrarchaeia archaeon]
MVFMVSLKKYVPCKCGANNSFDFSSDLSVDDLTLTARCPSCGAAVCISVSSLLSQPSPAQSQQAQTQPLAPVTIAEPSVSSEPLDAETKENVEQAVRDLFR